MSALSGNLQSEIPLSLTCPHCQAQLDTSDPAQSRCTSCGRTWPRREGILAFTAEAREYAFLSRLQQFDMPGIEETLAAAAAEHGWQTALTSYCRQAKNVAESNFIMHYTLEERRAAWKLLLPLNQETVALDYGCGFGVYSLNLARTCRHVFALDLTFARLKFLHLRNAQMGVNNITPVWAGDRLPLPFPDGSLDLVIMNGVLEWVAVRGSEPPESIQTAYLREMQRILRPGGHLYLGIENRYGYGYFLGKRDEHSNLRFATLLPRRLANLYSRLWRGKPYREYTHSPERLCAMVVEGGFSQIRLYAPIPNYNAPRFIVDMQDKAAWSFAFDYLVKPRNAQERLLKAGAPAAIRAGLLQRTAPALMILAQK